METLEQLREQYTEWTARYIDANRRLTDLLPSADMDTWIPTKEYLADFDKAERDIKRILDKLHKIADKLYKNR